MALNVHPSLIALQLNGDIGGETFYTRTDGTTVFFDKDRVDKPPTAKQIEQRQLFAAAQQLWANLSDSDKALLEETTATLSLPVTGQNLYISTAMKQTYAAYLALQKQAGVILPPPASAKKKACDTVGLRFTNKILLPGETLNFQVDPDFRGQPNVSINATPSQNLEPTSNMVVTGGLPGEAPFDFSCRSTGEDQTGSITVTCLYPDQAAFLCSKLVLLQGD